MKRLAILGLVIAVIVGGVGAQQFIDPFTYGAGTLIPGYTEQVGDWTVDGNQVLANPATTFQHLTYDGYVDRDMCIEIQAVYDTANPGLVYTGPIARHMGVGSNASYWMLKVQDNSSPYTGFDRWFLYYYLNGVIQRPLNYYADIVPPTQRMRVRLQVIEEAADVRVQMFMDTDLDGVWDVTQEWRTTLSFGTTGRVGIAGYRNTIADDLDYSNATLYLDGAPSIGTLVKYRGRGTPGLIYAGASSFGHAGIPLGDGREIPLTFDTLFLLSQSNPLIFQNYQGTVTASGNFTMGINIPPFTGLVGQTIWTSAVTVNANGIFELAPDVETTFVR